MFSFGIEYERAFSIAFWSARFAAGSPPPSRAATMRARASFEKSLPRFASAAPFLCLIELHLLCPDMALLPNQVKEALVDARVVGQLRVERGDDEASLAQQHRLAVELREHLDPRPDLTNAGRADEDAGQRLTVAGEHKIGLEARDLAAVGVPVDLDVDGAQVQPVEHDHPRAGAEHGACELAHRLVEPIDAHQAHERRRFASRDHEPVQAPQLLRLPDLDWFRAEPPQHRHMLAEVSLHCQDSNPHQGDCSFGLVAWPVTSPASWVASTKPEATIARRQGLQP